MKCCAILLWCGLLGLTTFEIEASAQEYAGPLLPHVGGQITTAFANRFGPDAEAYFTFTAVTPEMLGLNYSSTRGLNTRRNIRTADRQNSQTFVLGYATTIAGAQGRTVDRGHVVVTPRTTSASLYVGMSRGRDANHAHVVCDSHDHTEFELGDLTGEQDETQLATADDEHSTSHSASGTSAEDRKDPL